MNKIFDTKLYYNTRDKTSYILYDNNFYIVDNENKISIQDENDVVLNILSNNVISNTCDFYHLINFIIKNLVYSEKEKSWDIINTYLFKREFLVGSEYHRLIRIKKVCSNEYEYGFITPRNLKYIINVNY